MENIRPIDANELLHHKWLCDTRSNNPRWVVNVEDIEGAPTICIKSDKHSRWFEGHCVRCFYDLGYGAHTSDFLYCPHCGAKMDGEY